MQLRVMHLVRCTLTVNGMNTEMMTVACPLQRFATQLFTEVGNYWLPFNAHYFDMRRRLAVVACAISIDYDHYSRRAGGGGWLWPGAIIFGGGDD